MLGSLLTRRGVVAAGLAFGLTACGREKKAEGPAPEAEAPKAAPGAATGSLEWAVAGPWRGADAQRDAFRHPVETLNFFGLKPGMTVVEVWPGAGWYTQILAPFLKESGGKLYAATYPAALDEQSASATAVTAYRELFGGKPRLYGDIQFGSFGPASPPLAPPGTADLVLFMQTVHAWMAAGTAEKAFQDAFAALKPGGVLGVEAHRGEPGKPQDPQAANGYVQKDYVEQLAAEAGFKLDNSSEINANPKDTKDHPFGVWTLAPERRSAAPGAQPAADFDRARYDEIGESDRMTLRFVKPG